jgi:membrane protease YdiL (CAAX protease family)
MSPDQAVITLFLIMVLVLLLRPVQNVCTRWFESNPGTILAVPAGLTGLFLLAMWGKGGRSLPLAALVGVYTLVPALLAWRQGFAGAAAGPRPRGSWLDLLSILWLWLPLELSLGSSLLPVPIQGLAHTAAYGVAVLLGLSLFLIYRGLGGMKYCLPRKSGDAVLPAVGFVVCAALLIPLGRWLGFMGPFHIPANLSAGSVADRFLAILAGVALPEEILFRSLIQNWLMQRFGSNNRTLFLAAVIFGSAHLNNAPFPFPDWQYMILATIAGFVYGKVFQRATSVICSAALHATVNTVRHLCF